MEVAYFDYFEISMTLEQAASASHAGDCEQDVVALLELPEISDQLDLIGPDLIKKELLEFGWIQEELNDEELNRRRIVWLATGSLMSSHRDRLL